MGWENFKFEQASWRAVPSCNAIIPNGQPVTWSIICKDEPVILASGLHPEVAHYICNSHNVAIGRL